MPARHLSASLLLPLVAVAVLATACSTGGEDPATSAGAPASPPASGDTTAGSSTPTPTVTAATPAPAAAPVLTIAGFAYDVPASVPAGTEVQVVNEDREAHTVTLRGLDGPSLVVQGSSTATLTVPVAGTYEIVCDFHGGMTATLVVV